MEHRVLGRSGIEVSALSLGTMMFGSWGNEDAAECQRMVLRSLNAGITLFDTADIYDGGVSETILGEALKGHRDEVVLATKVGNPMSYDDPSQRGLSRRWIVKACEDSLRRLGTDRIDLYQMHRPDPDTSFEETLAAFDELVTSGKVRAIGTSTFSAEQIEQLHDLAVSAGTVVPTSEQPPYSALTRGIETAVLPTCARLGIGVIVWAPLNGGWLTGKYQQETTDESSRAIRKGEHFDHRDEEIRVTKRELVAHLTGIASEVGLSLVQLALGFVLDDPTVASAIIGPRTELQLEQLLADEVVALPAGVRAAIDALIAPGVNVNPANAE